MIEKISSLLRDVEKEYGITILFAVENGSRAWGMDSKDSDYDIRFVYFRPLKDYLTICPPEEVITKAYDKDFRPCKVQGSLVDMLGFDIFKFLKLLFSSNPTTIEWLYSPIVYLGSNDISLKEYISQNFSPEKLFHHYFSLFRNNYKLYIRGGQPITYKKYLYSIRGVLNAKYVYEFGKIPPVHLKETIEELADFLSEEFVRKINEVIEIKSQGVEKEIVLKIPVFDEFFNQEMERDYSSVPKRTVDRLVFDKFLQECLGVR